MPINNNWLSFTLSEEDIKIQMKLTKNKKYSRYRYYGL